MSRDYELGFILNPEVNEEQTRTIVERIEQIVSKYGGQVMRVNQWGRRRLAYPIDHHRDGLYVFIDMILTPETVGELDRTLKVSEEVIRHIIKKRDPKTVQKEREARAAAAQAQPATPPEVEAGAGSEAEVSASVEGEAPVAPDGEASEAPVVSEAAAPEAPAALNAEENAFVPPAAEDEAVEA